MQHLLHISVMLLQLSFISWTAEGVPQPYCYKNITETSYKVVTKSRIKNVSSKNFFRKITFKKDTQIEIYEDKEPVYKIKLERSCCEGYELTELDLCEPQCVQNGCPKHSKCIEPEVCECLKGYFSKRSPVDGKHYCEPICEKPCPQYSVCVAHNECACLKGHIMENLQCRPYCASGCPDGVCIAPNMCNCSDGYKSEKGSCLPVCSLGDQCKNGKCLAKDQCLCHPGFSWDIDTFTCIRNDTQSDLDYPDFIQPTESSIEGMTDIEAFNDNIDLNQLFDEEIETTSAIVDVHTKCPDDYIFHKGECLPVKFTSNELDCWHKSCQDKNAICLENGTCACIEGFKLFRTVVEDHDIHNHTLKEVCLSAAEYDARLQQDNQTKIVKDHINWSTIFFVVLGVLIIVCALLYLGVKLFLKQTGELDVEAKNLSCAYDKRAEKSVI